MARLDAAARFTPTLTRVLTAAVREHASAATPRMVSTVNDRKAAEVKARSEFSMIQGQPVQSIVVSVDGASPKAAVPCEHSAVRRTVVRERLLLKRVPQCQSLVGVFDHCVGQRVPGFRRFWPPKLFHGWGSKTSIRVALLPDQRKRGPGIRAAWPFRGRILTKLAFCQPTEWLAYVGKPLRRLAIPCFHAPIASRGVGAC
jgi:hypothetical protein